jgi:hypothetical protein
VFQVKLAKNPRIVDPVQWLTEHIIRESKKVNKLVARGARQYYLITNLSDSAHLAESRFMADAPHTPSRHTVVESRSARASDSPPDGGTNDNGVTRPGISGRHSSYFLPNGTPSVSSHALIVLLGAHTSEMSDVTPPFALILADT